MCHTPQHSPKYPKVKKFLPWRRSQKLIISYIVFVYKRVQCVLCSWLAAAARERDASKNRPKAKQRNGDKINAEMRLYARCIYMHTLFPQRQLVYFCASITSTYIHVSSRQARVERRIARLIFSSCFVITHISGKCIVCSLSLIQFAHNFLGWQQSRRKGISLSLSL